MAALIMTYFETNGGRFLSMLLSHVRISLIALAMKWFSFI